MPNRPQIMKPTDTWLGVIVDLGVSDFSHHMFADADSGDMLRIRSNLPFTMVGQEDSVNPGNYWPDVVIQPGTPYDSEPPIDSGDYGLGDGLVHNVAATLTHIDGNYYVLTPVVGSYLAQAGAVVQIKALRYDGVNPPTTLLDWTTVILGSSWSVYDGLPEGTGLTVEQAAQLEAAAADSLAAKTAAQSAAADAASAKTAAEAVRAKTDELRIDHNLVRAFAVPTR